MDDEEEVAALLGAEDGEGLGVTIEEVEVRLMRKKVAMMEERRKELEERVGKVLTREEVACRLEAMNRSI